MVVRTAVLTKESGIREGSDDKNLSQRRERGYIWRRVKLGMLWNLRYVEIEILAGAAAAFSRPRLPVNRINSLTVATLGMSSWLVLLISTSCL
jgi:hypothetical protein